MLLRSEGDRRGEWHVDMLRRFWVSRNRQRVACSSLQDSVPQFREEVGQKVRRFPRSSKLKTHRRLDQSYCKRQPFAGWRLSLILDHFEMNVIDYTGLHEWFHAILARLSHRYSELCGEYNDTLVARLRPPITKGDEKTCFLSKNLGKKKSPSCEIQFWSFFIEIRNQELCYSRWNETWKSLSWTKKD